MTNPSPIANLTLAAWINAVRAAIFAVLLAYGIGEASRGIAQAAVSLGGIHYVREPVAVALAFAAFGLWQRWSPAARFSPPMWGKPVPAMLIGLAFGLLAPLLALLLMQVLGAAKLTPPSAGDMPMMVLPAFFLLLHGLAEEVLVRGVAQRAGHYHLGLIGGIVLAGFAFASLQLLQGYASLFHLINALLFGLVLGVVALSKAGIWGAAIAHAAWSWLELIALGQKGQIVKTEGFWAGMGPDSYGSPAFSVVLVIALIAAWFVARPAFSLERRETLG